jgi:hypothetical protein
MPSRKKQNEYFNKAGDQLMGSRQQSSVFPGIGWHSKKEERSSNFQDGSWVENPSMHSTHKMAFRSIGCHHDDQFLHLALSLYCFPEAVMQALKTRWPA